MDFYDVIEKRRTNRVFLDRNVEKEKIDRILEAAYKVPTWNHRLNWHFIVLRTQEEKEPILGFAKKYADKFDADKYLNVPRPYPVTQGQKMFAYSVPLQYTMFESAKYVLIPVYRGREITGGSFSTLNQFSTVWCSVENIFLAATAEGLSCCMRIPADEEHEEAKKALKVPPTYRMPVFIGIGYPDPKEDLPVHDRPDMAKQIHYGKWR